MQFFAVLGSHPVLSLAEWRGLVNAAPVFSTKDVAIFEDLDNISAPSLQRQLGGTQRIGAIIGSFARDNHEEIAEFLSSMLIQETEGGKIAFGLSVFSDDKRRDHWKKRQQVIGMTVKRLLKEQGFSVRYVTSKDERLSSVVIRKNNLIDKGAEFVLIEQEKEIVIGMTQAVQDVDDWSKRDFGRPARDAKRGMLPPKLARMMLNIAGPIQEKTVLDPFCGSGTVLMEAIHLYADKVIGSDISEAAVEDTKKNLTWLESAYHLPTQSIELMQSTAANVGNVLPEESVDCVVTEPFLGRPRKGNESVDDVLKTISELNDLFKQSFASIKKVMKPGAVLVVASPIHLIRENTYPVATREILLELGFKETKLSPKPLLYLHKGQYVGREILRFVK